VIPLAGGLIGLGLLIILDAFARPAEPRATPGRATGALAQLSAALPRPGWAVLAGATAGTVALVATQWIALALVAAAAGAAAPGMAARAQAERRRLARQEALALVAGRLRDGIRGARGLPDAIVLAADTAPAALREEMAVLKAAVRNQGVAEGLEGLAAATDDPMVRRFARSLASSYRTGSRKVTLVLETVAEAATLQARTHREIRARQTHVRIAVHLMALCPLAALLLLRATNPTLLKAYSDAPGQLVMLVGLGLVALGWWVARSIGRRT